MNLKRGAIVPSFAVCCYHCRAHEIAKGAETKSEAGSFLRQGDWSLTLAFGWICPNCDKSPK